MNLEKCEFGKSSIKFLGHTLGENGISADPEKVSAITGMAAPTNVPELRRFVGMVNQLSKFFYQLAELNQPLRELLSKGREWTWGPAQEKAFQSLKEEIAKATTLALYDPAAKTIVSADASSFGLGAVLFQEVESGWRAVAFASRSMSESERYAQIEKEALAVAWACDEFEYYLLGKKFTVETDHKPLLGTKNLDFLPPRILRFRLRMARFNYQIVHVPGNSSTLLMLCQELQLGKWRREIWHSKKRWSR